MSDLEVFSFLHERLQQRTPAVLLVVVESQGESPGRAGFKMVVTATECRGTVGGGAVEHDAVERVRALLAEGADRSLLLRAVHRAEAEAASGLICGGEQTLLMHPVRDANAAAVAAALACLATPGASGWFDISPPCFAFHSGHSPVVVPDLCGDREGEWRYREPVGSTDTVYLIGGGHVSLALSKLLSELNVRIVVLDERAHVSTFVENRWAHEKIVVPFAQAAARIPDGPQVFVVIMTPGHQADEEVLRQLAERPLRYLGLMGSATKIAGMFQRLEQAGIDRRALARVHAPVGVAIGSQTPAEIAISIAAEIIRERTSPPST